MHMWAAKPPHPQPSSSAAQPSSDELPRPRPTSRAAQPASHSSSPRTSADTLLDIEDCIRAADARDYDHWRRKNPQEPRKSVGNLVGHIQSAFRQRFESSAEQPASSAEPRVPLVVLLGWLAEKIKSNGADIDDAKELLREFARDEHRLYRMKQLVATANSMDCLLYTSPSPRDS